MREGIIPATVAFAIVGTTTALTIIRWIAPGENHVLSIVTLALLGLLVVWGRDALIPRRFRRAAHD